MNIRINFSKKLIKACKVCILLPVPPCYNNTPASKNRKALYSQKKKSVILNKQIAQYTEINTILVC
jgi:hypothetical protein